MIDTITEADLLEVARATWRPTPHPFLPWFTEAEIVPVLRQPDGPAQVAALFKARAELERWANASCINGVFLDELDPEAGRHEEPINDDCGILCELQALQPTEQPGVMARDTK